MSYYSRRLSLRSRTILGGKAINQCKSVTSDLRSIHNPGPNGSPQVGVHVGPIKPIKTRVLISDGSANPSLNITHVPRKVLLTLALTHDEPELLHRLAETVHAVVHVLHAVTQCVVLSGLHSLHGAHSLHERRA